MVHCLVTTIHIIDKLVVYLFYIVNRNFHACGAVIGGQKDDRSLDRIDLADAARVLPIRTPGLARIGGEVENCDFRVLAGADGFVDEGELLIQKNLLALGQFDLVVGQPARLRDDPIEAGECGKGRKLRRAVVHAHVLAVRRLMVRQMEDVRIGIHLCWRTKILRLKRSKLLF